MMILVDKLIDKNDRYMKKDVDSGKAEAEGRTNR